MSDEQKPSKPLDISVSENLIITEEAEMAIFATITPAGQEPNTLIYDFAVESEVIAHGSTEMLTTTLKPKEFEIVTETVERSKGLGTGIKFCLEFFGIGKLEFEKKPRKEIKTTTKATYGVPQKK